MINDSAISYFEKVTNGFPDSKFRYQSMVALNDIEDKEEYWENFLKTEYPDSTYTGDSSYKTIDIIKEIDSESFIDIENNRLELLNIFSNSFIDKDDNIMLNDTTNINLDTLNRAKDVQ